MSPVEAIFVPSPPKTGKKMLHARPPPIVERVGARGARNQGTRESLDYWRSLEAPGQVNASLSVFYLIFENDDCSRARVLHNDAGA